MKIYQIKNISRISSGETKFIYIMPSNSFTYVHVSVQEDDIFILLEKDSSYVKANFSNTSYEIYDKSHGSYLIYSLNHKCKVLVNKYLLEDCIEI